MAEVDDLLKGATGLALVFEVWAISADLLDRAGPPTISALCHQYPLLIPLVLGGLALHLMPRLVAWLLGRLGLATS